MAATWPLSDIEQLVRKITGRFSPTELTTDQLRKMINQYYTLTFPAEVKLEEKLTYYQFTTEPNQPTYDVPQTTYTNFLAPATCNNLNMLWYQDPTQFLSQNWLQYSFTTPWTGDGSTTAFSTTVTGFPIYPATTTISDGVETFVDTNTTYTDANVSITGSEGGTATVNSSTGVVNVTFNSAPANGANVNLNYVLFAPTRPQAILYFNNQFQLYPVPDQAYIIKMQAYSVVSELVNATDTPQLNEWGPCIAYGTARDIFTYYGQYEERAKIEPLYIQQVNYVLTRTCQDMINTRSRPMF